jgi:hypothetical protein
VFKLDAFQQHLREPAAANAEFQGLYESGQLRRERQSHRVA